MPYLPGAYSERKQFKKFKSLEKRTRSGVLLNNTTTKRASEYGSNWDVTSRTCLSLANRVCQKCGGLANRAHHIVPLSKGGSNAQFNLMAVCENCHISLHKHLQRRVK